MFVSSLRSQIALVLLVIGLYYANKSWRTPKIPAHMLGHRATFLTELMSEEEATHLRELAKEMADFPSISQDLEFYKTAYEHIGEAEPMNKDGSCSHPLLVANNDRTECILPGRIDISRHYMKFGGIEGMKEDFWTSISRIQSFARYNFDLNKFPAVKAVFGSERFLKEAVASCPKNKKVLEAFQFNFVLQIPGQTAPVHLDGVYFEHATRFQYPQWLLAVMQQSGLYQDKFVDQIQAVGYFHEWNSTQRGGQFLYYAENDVTPVEEHPYSRGGSIIDGSKVIHAARVYLPDRTPPVLKTFKNNRLHYRGDDTWEVTTDGEVVGKYATNELRMTIVYRARCFATEQKRQEFNDWHKTTEGVRPIEDFLEDLKADLVAKKGYSMSYLNGLSKFDLAILLLDEYVAYPISSTAFCPYNYCALNKVLPWTESFLKYFC